MSSITGVSGSPNISTPSPNATTQGADVVKALLTKSNGYKSPVVKDSQRLANASGAGPALKTDGVMGSKTRAALNKVLTSIAHKIIQKGASNIVTRSLQTLLKAKGADIKVDGDFGANTTRAVNIFQKNANLPQTGKVDHDTLLALASDVKATKSAPDNDPLKDSLLSVTSSFNAADTDATPAAAFPPAPPKPVGAAASTKPVNIGLLEKGNQALESLISKADNYKSPEVKDAQLLANALGISPAIKADGAMGPKTRAALKKIVSADHKITQKGSNPKNVRSLQTLLKAKGADIKVDGDFGAQTTAAVKAFQEKCDLTPTGKIDHATALALAGDIKFTTPIVAPPVETAPATAPATTKPAPPAPATTKPAPPAPVVSQPVITQGAAKEGINAIDALISKANNYKSPAVQNTQLLANALGISPTLKTDGAMGPKTRAAFKKIANGNHEVIQKGASKKATTALQTLLRSKGINISADGDFGPKTTAAVKAFQRKANLPLTGKVDHTTALALASKTRVAAAVAKPQPAAGNRTASIGWPPNLSKYNHSSVNTKLDMNNPNIKTYKKYYYGTARTIALVESLADEYNRRTGHVLRVGDISKKGGGKIPGHGSHQTGKNIDLDLSFTDGRTTAEPNREGKNASWRSSAYDRNATRTMIKLIKKAYPSAQILFSDPVLVKEGLVRKYVNHDNHLHIQSLY